MPVNPSKPSLLGINGSVPRAQGFMSRVPPQTYTCDPTPVPGAGIRPDCSRNPKASFSSGSPRPQGRPCQGRKQRKEGINTVKHSGRGRVGETLARALRRRARQMGVLGVPPGRGLRCGPERRRLRPHPRSPSPAWPLPVRSPARPPPSQTQPPPQTPSRPWVSQTHLPRSLPAHLKPPAPRWAPPCGNCPWRRRDGGPSGAAETWTAAAGPQPAPARTAGRAQPIPPPPAAARPRPSAAAAPPEVWRRKAGPACRGKQQSSSRGGQHALWHGVTIAGLSPQRRPSTPAGRLDNNRPALSHLPAPTLQQPALESARRGSNFSPCSY